MLKRVDCLASARSIGGRRRTMGSDPVRDLTALLREANVVPRIHPDAFALSSIYDSTYRAIILALTLEICAKRRGNDSEKRLHNAKVKLFQFVAVHPDLMPSLRGWLRAHEEGQRPSLDGWARFPRGYAADTLYERVIGYLLATGELSSDGAHLWRPQGKRLLSGMFAVAIERDAFTRERGILTELATIKITNKMLST